MKKKYFTDEEKRVAKNKQQQKYYNKIKKQPLSDVEKENLKKEKEEKRKKYLKEYYIKNKEKIKKCSVKNYSKNKEKRLEQNKKIYNKRRNTDPLYKLTTNIRRNIRMGIKKKKYVKKSRSNEILGTSYENFKLYLESKFESWMNWDNYGLYNGELNYGWDLDHIIPISTAISEEDVIKLNHYTNFQPLCSHLNRNIKRNNH